MLQLPLVYINATSTVVNKKANFCDARIMKIVSLMNKFIFDIPEGFLAKLSPVVSFGKKALTTGNCLIKMNYIKNRIQLLWSQQFIGSQSPC